MSDHLEADRLPIASGRAVRAEVRRAMSGRWWLATVIVVVMAAAAAAGLVLPIALGSIVDNIGSHRSESFVIAIAAVIVGAAIVRAVLLGVGIVLSARLFDRLVAWLRERLVDRALDLPQQTLERAGPGDLVSRVGDDIYVVSDSMSRILPSLSVAGFTIVVTVAGLGALDLRFLIVFVIVVPVQWVAVRYYLRTAPPVWAEARVKAAARSNQVLGSLQGADTVIAYRMTDAHLERIAASSWSVVRYGLLTRIVLNRFATRLTIAEFAGLGGLLVVGYVLVDSGHATVGAATTAMLFLLQIFEPIGNILTVLDDLQTAAASLARVVGVIELADGGPTGSTPAPNPAPTPASTPALSGVRFAQRGAICIRGLTFAYSGGQPVLRNISLDIAPGEHVALVGPSGAGKSTLAALIAGIHQPQHGTIAVDGTPLEGMTPHDVAATISLVTQETHTFSGTLRDDLTIADPNATDARLHEVLSDVHANGWTQSLPEGLDTIVGRHAHQLTTAQAQQLALARLKLKDPPIAILDEATADAGSNNARLLERAADAVIRGRTALTVAHRLSQAARADRIIVMAGGHIVETGSHDQLVLQGGHYARLWKVWATHR